VVVPRSAAPGHYVVWAGLFDTDPAGPPGRRARASAPRTRVVDDAVAVAELEVAP